MSVLCLDNTALEALLWDDIVSDGLDAVTSEQHSSETTSHPPEEHNISPSSRQSPPPRVAVAAPNASPTPAPTMSADHPPAAQQQQLQQGGGGTAVSAARADSGAGPFAAVRHQPGLSLAPSGALRLPRASSLNPSASLVAHKTRALAAAAGSLRGGAVGSNLRLAAIMCRSNSGGLADTLLSEHARAESGLLTVCLPRSDSLPELGPGPSAELQELFAASELDFYAGVPAAAGMPSLSMLFAEAPLAAVTAGAAGAGEAPAAAALGDEPALPWAGASRMLAQPPSFSAKSAAALYAAGAQLPSRPSMFGLQQQQPAAADATAQPTPARAPGSSTALRPPTLLDFRQMLMRERDDPFSFAAAAASGPSMSGLPPVLAGFDGYSLSLPSFSKQLMERQDTFDTLLRQVDQELCAEAELRQYAALEYDTMNVPMPMQAPPPAAAAGAAAAAAHVSPFGDPSLAAADVLQAAAAAAEPAAAAAGVKQRSVFEVKRVSVFEGRAALWPADPSAASAVPHGSAAAAAAAAPLDTTGPSFGCWVPPVDPAAAAAAAGAAAASPFALPDHTGLLAGAGDSAGAGAAVPAEQVQQPVKAPRNKAAAAKLGKQEVARYSRVITCKTYLKRLNITQPMAEHLLPPHSLNVPAAAAAAAAAAGSRATARRTSCDGGSDDEAGPSAAAAAGGGGKKQTQHYEQLFKDQISVVDEAGGAFRVQYEGVSCNAQKHLRLTSGWRDYIRAHDVQVGDTVVFERRGDERTVLYVTLLRGGEEGPAGQQGDGPAPKKRRISRKQAAQRLD